MVTRYNPDDTWPTHDKPWWQRALKAAQAAGWVYEYIGAKHTHGVGLCPAGEHTFKVDCTAKAGEAFAVDAEKAVRECRHGTPPGPRSKVADRQEQSKRLLDTAERLVTRAEDALARTERFVVASAELERLALLIETAEENVRYAARLDSGADLAGDDDESDAAAEGPAQSAPLWEELLEEQDRALERAASLEGAPPPEAIADSLDRAGAAVDEASALVARIRRDGLAKPLRERAEAVKAEIARLRHRLQLLKDEVPG